MGINTSASNFDVNLRNLINKSGLPPCVVRLELLSVIREVEDLEKMAVNKEQEAEDAAGDSRE